jgi:magnesium transporter
MNDMALAFDVPGMRPLTWQAALDAPQAIVQFPEPDEVQIAALAGRFGLHELQIKDMRNPQHPARLFKIGKGQLLILRLPRHVDGRLKLSSVSLLFDAKLCAIVWSDAGEALARRQLGGVDIHDAICRAAHALTDRLFAHLAPMLEGVDELEDASFADIEHADMAGLLTMRQNLVMLARGGRGNAAALEPLQGQGGLAGNPYLADACEHMQRATVRAESTAEHLLAVMQALQSLLGQRMNETIKVLTIITVVLSPLAVITGIFGMNFEHMPILKWGWGFSASLVLMLAVAGVLATVFKRRGWW